MLNPDPVQKNAPPEMEPEINLLDYWRVIRKYHKLIGKIVLVSVFATALTSLCMTNIYQSRAVITPVASKDTASAGSTASMMVQQFGIMPLGQAPGTEIFNLLKSNILREKLIEKHQLLPILFEKKWDPVKKDWIRGGLSLNPLTWIRPLLPQSRTTVKKDPGVPDTWDGLRSLEGIIKVSQNIKDNTITITTEFKDPELAAKITNDLLSTLVDHMTGEAKRVAKTNKEYLEDQINKNSDPFIKQKIYFLIAQQIETMMMAEVKENFAFKVLDPPKVPDQKVKPKRLLMVVLAAVVSLFIAVFTAFFKEYLQKLKAGS